MVFCEFCEECCWLIEPELIPSFIAVFTIIWAHYLVMRHQKCKVHPHSLQPKNPIYVAPKQLYCSSPLTAFQPTLLCSVPQNNWEYSNFQQREQLWSGLGTLISSPLPSHKIPMHRTPLIFYRNEKAFILEDELDRADENKGSCKLLKVNWYFGWPHFWPASNRILTTLFLNSILLSRPVSHNIMLLCAYSEYDHKIVELGDRVPVSILSLLRIRSNMCSVQAARVRGRKGGAVNTEQASWLPAAASSDIFMEPNINSWLNLFWIQFRKCGFSAWRMRSIKAF